MHDTVDAGGDHSKHSLMRASIFQFTFLGVTSFFLACTSDDKKGAGMDDAAETGDEDPTTDETGDEVDDEIEGAPQRLQYVNYVSEAGVEFPRWVRDTELGLDCQAQSTAEGYACLPYGASDTLADEACTTPGVVLSDECDEPQEYYSVRDRTANRGCDGLGVVRAMKRGALVDDGRRFETSGDMCIESAYEPSLFSMYVVEPEPLSTFVELERHSQGDGEKTTDGYLSESGFFLPTSLSLNGTPCRIIEVGDELRCLPSATQVFGGAYFADSTCETPAAGVFGYPESCEAPAFVAITQSSDEACPTRTTTYFELGSRLPEDGLYQQAGMCLVSSIPEFAGYPLGDEVSPESFPLIEETHVGEGRLRRVERRFADQPDSTPFVPTFAWDEERGAHCWFTEFQDGTIACLPSNVRVVNSSSALFADAECSRALTYNDLCQPAEFAYEFVDVGDCGGGVATLYEFGARFVENTHFVRTDTGCEEVDSTGVDDLFELTEVEPSSAVPVAVRGVP